MDFPGRRRPAGRRSFLCAWRFRRSSWRGTATPGQTLSLIGELQRELGFAMIFVTHNLAVASRMCGRLAVMREGRIIEQGSREDILERPREAYTRELIEAVPELPDPEGVTDGTVAAP